MAIRSDDSMLCASHSDHPDLRRLLSIGGSSLFHGISSFIGIYTSRSPRSSTSILAFQKPFSNLRSLPQIPMSLSIPIYSCQLLSNSSWRRKSWVLEYIKTTILSTITISSPSITISLKAFWILIPQRSLVLNLPSLPVLELNPFCTIIRQDARMLDAVR